MELFRHRKPARIIACFDAVFTCASMVFLAERFVFSLILGMGALILSGSKVNRKGDTNEDDHAILTALLVSMPFVIILALIVGCIELWAIFVFLKNTNQGADLIIAIRRTVFWRNVMIGFVALGVVYCLISQSWIPLAIHVIVRAIMIYFVIQFSKEMGDFVLSGGSQLPTQYADENKC